MDMNTLRILYINSRSMKNKMDELEILIYEEHVEIIVIAETWVKKQEQKYYNFKNFTSFFVTRKKIGGGLGIFVKTNINAEIVEKIENELSYITLKIKPYNFILCAIYKPPSIKNKDFMRFLDQKLENVTNMNLECFCIGDVNINILEDNNETKSLMDIYHSNSFKLCNTNISTRDTKNSSTLIDHVITNSVKDIKIKFIDSPLSDHKIQVINVSIKSNQPNSRHEHISINKFNIEQLKNELFILDQRKFVFQNVNAYYDTIINIFKKCSYTVLIKQKRNSKPWFNEELTRLIKKRDIYYRKKKKYQHNKDFANIYNFYNKLVKKNIRLAKQYYYKEQFENTDQKKIWENLNLLLTAKTKSYKPNIDYLEINNNKIESEKMICEEMNNHFINVGPKLSNQIPFTKKPEEERNPKSFYLDENEITNEDIEEIIDNLNPRKACGFDNITIKVIKTVKIELLPILKHLVKLSFQTSTFPQQMKLAKVSPIFKNNKTNDPNNYRPISVLPTFSKILEKIMNNKLVNFLEKQKLFSNNQYGFRKSRDTEAAAIDLITDIRSNLDQNKKCAILSLDLCKAFDTVNHDILIGKLFDIGIRGKINCWFESYLKERKQFVKIGNSRSSSKIITCGVPQGSILGPVLFLIYINSMPKLKLKGTIKLFADDTTIVYFADSITEIRCNITYDLEILYNWLQSHKLTLNLNKSSYMFINKQQTNEKFNCITLNNRTIVYTKTIKFLGLHIDENLNWRKHIEYLRKYISPLIGILFKIRNCIPLKFLKNIYFSLVHSKIQYLISIWGSTNNIILKPLNILQNKIIKCIHRLPYLEPTINLYKPLGYFDINNLYKLKTCIFIHSLILREKNSNIQINMVNDLHTYNTRQIKLLQTIPIKSNFGMRSLMYIGIKIYNKLPTNIKEIKKISLFKIHLKRHFLKR